MRRLRQLLVVLELGDGAVELIMHSLSVSVIQHRFVHWKPFSLLLVLFPSIPV
jgi:hypothetical protein